MINRYSKKGYPSEFPVRSKCIALFQKIQGIDVLIFGMYVHEYDHDCPAPNRRRVYISYLDSVQYFEPKCYRRTAHHALLVEYLRYAKERGFHTAHIWSCPPTPGDSNIFNCHPHIQKIPRDIILRKWYTDALGKAQDEGIVLETKTLHEEYFENGDTLLGRVSDPTCLPYFQGDYVPGEIESIIQKEGSIKEEEGSSAESPDTVMTCLGKAIGNMKENFIVAHLRSRGFASAVERGDDVSNWIEPEESLSVAKRPKIGGKTSPGTTFPGMKPPSASDGNKQKGPIIKEEPLKPPDDGTFRKNDSGKKDDDDAISLGTVSVSLGPKDSSFADAFGLDDSDKGAKEDLDPLSLDDLEPEALSLRGGGGEGLSGNKRGFDEIEPAIARFAAANNTKEPIRDTSDPDEPQEFALLETRQHFVDYCRQNNLQFDELRRAKHATMVLLYHMHSTKPKPKVESDQLRIQSKRRQQQQQLMDDRRRKAQNDLYQNASK